MQMVQSSGGVKPYLRIALIAHTPTMLGHSLKSVGNSNTHRTALQSTVWCSFLASAFEPSIARTWADEINSHESDCSFLGNWQRLQVPVHFRPSSSFRISTTNQHHSVNQDTPLDKIADHEHLNTFSDGRYSLPQSNYKIYVHDVASP
jgi:hypothetical protein